MVTLKLLVVLVTSRLKKKLDSYYSILFHATVPVILRSPPPPTANSLIRRSSPATNIDLSHFGPVLWFYDEHDAKQIVANFKIGSDFF